MVNILFPINNVIKPNTLDDNIKKINENLNIVNKDNLFSKFAQKDGVPKEKQVSTIIYICIYRKQLV